MARAPKHGPVVETGILMDRDVKLGVEWPKFAANMIKTVIAGFAAAHGAVEHAGEALASLLEAGGNISMEASPGQRGWTLFALGFAWSFDELRARGQLDDAGLEPAVRDALQDAKRLVDEGEQIIPVSFLEQPTTLPLYRLVRDAFVARKAAFRPAGGEADAVLRARFDAAFDRAIFLLWSQAPEQYQPLAAALTAPGAAAHAFKLEWDAYRRSLIYDFEVKPVFGQETTRVSLAQLYVPLRGAWTEDVESVPLARNGGLPAKPANVKPGAKRTAASKTAHLVLLDDELEEWALNGPDEYQLKLIGGSPGSGKSTTAKAVGRRLAGRDNCRPVLVPLSHIDLTSDLREQINLYFARRTASPFRQPPLSRKAVEEDPPLVLIFDGLDELARPGEAANDVTRDFMVKLGQLTGELCGEGKRRLRAMVFGRLPSFQAAQRYAGAASQRCYEVIGYTPARPAAWLQLAHVTPQDATATAGSAKRELADLDQRKQWWQRYAAATGAPSEPPEALTGAALDELTREPLLCYLLALSGYLTQDAELAAGNVNLVYHELVDEVWRRGWGDGQGRDHREGAGKYLDRDGFNRLMETVALAAWQGGDTRVCSEANFLAATKALRTYADWEAFERDNGPDITNLAMNFYLRGAENEARGFEFTHKNFGEHLAARAILTVATDLAALVDRRIEAAMKEWFDVTSSGRLTYELLGHMLRELRLRAEAPGGVADVTALQEAFQRIATDVLRNGLPANGNADQPWRVAESRQRNAEGMVWAVLHACAWARSTVTAAPARIEVTWPDASAFGDLLRRVASQSDMGAAVVRTSLNGVAGLNRGSAFAPAVMRCFAYVVAPGADLTGQALFGTNMRFADLRGARLEHASLLSCDLRGADLSEAKLSGASIEHTMFDNAVLLDAKLRGAILTQSSLLKAQVTRADLTGSVICNDKAELDQLRGAGAEMAGARLIQ